MWGSDSLSVILTGVRSIGSFSPQQVVLCPPTLLPSPPPHPPATSFLALFSPVILAHAGHLSCLSATDLYRYLSQEHDATTVGVLLGMAASKRGTLDPVISKMLFLHVPARHPSTYPELELSPLVQASALLGVGLLYQGSCHRQAPSHMASSFPGVYPPPSPPTPLP